MYENIDRMRFMRDHQVDLSMLLFSQHHKHDDFLPQCYTNFDFMQHCETPSLLKRQAVTTCTKQFSHFMTVVLFFLITLTTFLASFETLRQTCEDIVWPSPWNVHLRVHLCAHKMSTTVCTYVQMLAFVEQL